MCACTHACVGMLGARAHICTHAPGSDPGRHTNDDLTTVCTSALSLRRCRRRQALQQLAGGGGDLPLQQAQRPKAFHEGVPLARHLGQVIGAVVAAGQQQHVTVLPAAQPRARTHARRQGGACGQGRVLAVCPLVMPAAGAAPCPACEASCLAFACQAGLVGSVGPHPHSHPSGYLP